MTFCPSIKSVLIADNDPDVYESARFLLEAAGYSIKAAQSLDEARQLLESEIIHAAVIDLRLTDNAHPEDISGFQLGGELPAQIPFVIFTAYRDIDNLRRAMGEIGAKDVIDKNDPDASEQLLAAVEKLFANHVPANFDLTVSGSLDPQEIAKRIELPAEYTARPSEEDVCLILRSLFAEATHITVRALFDETQHNLLSHSGSVLLRVNPEYTHGHPGAPLVVKFSARDKIEREEENYGNLMRYIGGTRLAVLDESACSRHIGALSYRLFGQSTEGTLRHFRDLFQDRSVDDALLSNKLVHFLGQAFKTIYASAEEVEVDLLAHYVEVLGLSPAKLRASADAVACYLPNGQVDWAKFGWTQQVDELPDPVAWVCRDGQWQSYRSLTSLCLCHGDLHSRNILVDSEMGFWLIDFERSAVSHCLRDLAELETDIKFQISSFDNLVEYYTLEAMLLDDAFGTHGSEDSDAMRTLTPAVRHAFQLIQPLRLLMRERFFSPQHLLEYDIALFMTTLNIIRLKATSDDSQRLAYFSAALLCEKIQKKMNFAE